MIFGAQTPTQHLTYCTNVHPGEHATDVANVLSEHVPAVRDALGHKGPFGVGLRISDMASRELSQPEGIEHLRGLLDQHELYVFTLNGFPYGTFHRAPVKDLVHRPDWTEPARLDYLARLAHLLSKLDLPDNEGSISTSPLGYRKHHPDAKSAIEASALALATLCNELHTLEAETGQWIHVDLEPEPDGLLEQLDETAEFFVEVLLRAGRDHLGRIAGISSNQAEAWLRRYLGVCLDVCHAAVRFESVDEGLERLAAEDIAIGKIQLSSAIEAHWSSADEATAVVEALRFFDEPVYVHQAVRRGHDG
ncbi:MAG: metabolite traffic protein EboE, partial [Myxococcota bacterium]